jgi:hypothetical protein
MLSDARKVRKRQNFNIKRCTVWENIVGPLEGRRLAVCSWEDAAVSYGIQACACRAGPYRNTAIPER